MSHLRTLRFNEKNPQICVNLREGTVTDIGGTTQDIMKKPFDVIHFHADEFNGVMNFSTLWNAMLMIAKESEEAHLIFSCDWKNLPEYFKQNGTMLTSCSLPSRPVWPTAWKLIQRWMKTIWIRFPNELLIMVSSR
jgi:hypothetical protein